MQQDIIFCLLKFHRKDIIERLVSKGELYFSPPDIYNDDKNVGRGDEFEGAEWVDNSQIVKIEVENPEIGAFTFIPKPNALSKIIQYHRNYLSYSLMAITPSSFKQGNPFRIEDKMLEFGDSAVIIEDPYRFFRAIGAKLKEANVRYSIGPIEYIDLKSEGRKDLTPFHKREDHAYQMEYRVIIESKDGIPKIFNIGSIEDYCKVTTSKNIIETMWKAKKHHT